MLRHLLILITVVSAVSLAQTDLYRSAFHFSPQEAWLNDPNGLIYYEGEYHLFYQYHPDDTVWGPMHWGHAVSTDLLNWEELPIALYPDELGTIFSGSAVIDYHNTAGFGEEAMVAVFTHFVPGLQQQSLAYSTDKGRIWTKYEGNPVLPPPVRTMQNFRDPKVFWYGSEEAGHWVMSIAAGTSILFFTSPNLIDWESSGGFGLTHGATCGVWETPDLFELKVDDTSETRWVLTVGIGDCAPAGGSGQQYFIGQFDGETFSNANDKDLILWVDFGADFYAGQSWSNLADRRIWTGWMNNWTYAQAIPTGNFRGALNLPRELSLTQTDAGIRLKQTPIRELESLRTDAWSWENETITEGINLLEGLELETFEVFLDVEVNPLVNRVGLKVRTSESTETVFGFSPKAGQLFFGRGNSGRADFSDDYSLGHIAELSADVANRIRLHAVVDKASIEIFANDGVTVMSEQFFALENAVGLELFVEGSDVTVHKLNVWKLGD